jgi:ATP-dependent DNA ligase
MPRIKAGFIEPMLLLRTDQLPDDAASWSYELKLDGYRAVAFKTSRTVHLRSRNDNDFSVRYPAVVRGLTKLPNETVIDGELIALAADGRPSFHAFRILTLRARSFSSSSLTSCCLRVETSRPRRDARRALLERRIIPQLTGPVRYTSTLDAPLRDITQSVKALKLEGVVAKRRDSRYEPGLRSGAWLKMRINQGQEFVIGGYTLGTKTFDALIFGYYEGARLMYTGRTRNGFTPAGREQLFKQLRRLETAECPFANLPEPTSGRWGQGLTKTKMGDCRWLKPVLVGQFEFLEWTTDNHLRHTRFMGLREDKSAGDVSRE